VIARKNGQAFIIPEAGHGAIALMGWVRSEDPDQRCRTVLATNPPVIVDHGGGFRQDVTSRLWQLLFPGQIRHAALACSP
jgi:hypothetical protein